MTLRVAFIGCVASSEVALRAILSKEVEVVGIVTRKTSLYNSDFVSLQPLASSFDIPFFLVEDGEDDGALGLWLKEKNPDLIFCVGWSRILGKEILRVAPNRIVGFHPTALPQNRGRHPLVWTLVLGLKETASSFFIIDEGADSGPIINQKFIPIGEQETASSLYQKILDVIPVQVAQIIDAFSADDVVFKIQDETKATYWRKRGVRDGEIDWRMSSGNIYNLVRALSKPYLGAHFSHKGHMIKVWKCSVENCEMPNAEPGKILDVSGSTIVVKSGDRAVALIEHELLTIPKVGEYL
jgi:methionyl-tRNA formyltransferase